MPQSSVAVPHRLFLLLLLSTFAASGARAADAWWHVAQQLQPAGAVDFTPHGTQPGLSNDLQVSDQCASCHSANADDERAFRPQVRIRGTLADVWTEYDFHFGQTPSHCGVDSIHLLKISGAWKIVSIADTYEATGCPARRPPE